LIHLINAKFAAHELLSLFPIWSPQPQFVAVLAFTCFLECSQMTWTQHWWSAAQLGTSFFRVQPAQFIPHSHSLCTMPQFPFIF